MKKFCLLLVFCFFITSIFCGCVKDNEAMDDSSSINEQSSAEQPNSSEPSSESQTSEENTVDAYQRDLKIYTDYLQNGGYEKLYFEYYNAEQIRNDCTIHTKLFDLDCEANGVTADNSYELFISIKGVVSEHTTALLTIKNGKPKIMFRAEHGGGSMGGNDMSVYWDTNLQKYAVQITSTSRDGTSLSNATSNYYTADNEYAEPTLTTYVCELDPNGIYSDEASKVKKETDIYEETPDRFTYFKVNGEYVTKTKYQESTTRFVNDSEHDLTKIEGTYNVPIV